MNTNLQKLRKQAGWKSAHAFADHMGISRSTYTHYEQGNIVMPLDKACAFADEFDVSLDELLGRTPPTKKARQESQAERRRKVLYAMIDLLDESEGGTNDD